MSSRQPWTKGCTWLYRPVPADILQCLLFFWGSKTSAKFLWWLWQPCIWSGVPKKMGKLYWNKGWRTPWKGIYIGRLCLLHALSICKFNYGTWDWIDVIIRCPKGVPVSALGTRLKRLNITVNLLSAMLVSEFTLTIVQDRGVPSLLAVYIVLWLQKQFKCSLTELSLWLGQVYLHDQQFCSSTFWYLNQPSACSHTFDFTSQTSQVPYPKINCKLADQ